MTPYSLTWLAPVLKDAGLKVATVDGWEHRGSGDVGEIRGERRWPLAMRPRGDERNQTDDGKGQDKRPAHGVETFR